MSEKFKKPTLNRILRSNGRVLMVAMDHARMNGVYKGLENPGPVIEAVIEGGADAIMTSYGVIKNFGHLMAGRVAKVLRLDTGPTKYGQNWEEYTEWHTVFSVEDALRVGADGVITYAFPGIAVDGTTLKNMGRVAADADRYNVPFIAEMHACPAPNVPDPYDPEVIASISRIAAEFGADMVKVDYSGSAETFSLATSCCPVPLIIAGGRLSDTTEQTLRIMRGAMDAGAAGPVFGRQIWRNKHPVAITRALAAIVHQDASVEEALAVYEEHSGKPV